MMNCSIFALAHVLTQLMAAEGEYRQMAVFADAAQANPALRAKAEAIGASAGSIYVSDRDKERAQGLLQLAIHLADQMELEATHHRADMFDIRLKQMISLNDFAAEFRALREAIEGEIRFHYFFHYSKKKASLQLHVASDWAATLSAFELARYDIEQAVDCYACEHNTAAVFHLMRVAEHGLRGLARELRIKLPKKRSIEWEDWNGVLMGIKGKSDAIANRPRGPNRDAALGFYRGALTEFEGFKDEFRNNVMHARKSYDEHQALSLLLKVRDFVERLSAKTDQAGKRIIWGRI